MELEIEQNIVCTWLGFDELSNQQIYALLKLRQDVFILEQQCLYSDLDDLDQHCMHLLAMKDSQLVGYLRFIPSQYHPSNNVALGRIISISEMRGTGLGSTLVNHAIIYSQKNYPSEKIQLSAQHHLQSFYKKQGFESFGRAYDDEGILHIDMLYQDS